MLGHKSKFNKNFHFEGEKEGKFLMQTHECILFEL